MDCHKADASFTRFLAQAEFTVAYFWNWVATWEPAIRCLFMEHKGVRYELLQTVDPAGWKWIAHISHTKQITGFSHSRDLAIHAARRGIEKAMKAAEDKR